MELSEACEKLSEVIKQEECLFQCGSMILHFITELENDETPSMALAIAKNIETVVEQEMITASHALESY